MCVYIYIYNIYREREREREKQYAELKLSANAGTEINTHWQVMVACIETSNVKFTGIIEIFEFLKLVAI